jgi:hypothetical protein
VAGPAMPAKMGNDVYPQVIVKAAIVPMWMIRECAILAAMTRPAGMKPISAKLFSDLKGILKVLSIN